MTVARVNASGALLSQPSTPGRRYAMATTWQGPADLSTAQRRQRARDRLIALARLMDSAVTLPGVRGGVGLDAVLGLVPVAGDLVSALIGLYSVAQARELGASRWLQARMVGNLLLDAAIGAVPVAGDIADVFFRAHRRNLKLLQRELGEPWLEPDGRQVRSTPR